MNLRRLGLLLCLGLCVGVPAAADDLGRLFTTPAERARIDAVRAGRAPATTTDASVRIDAGDRLILNGSVVGSDGRRLVWLNGQRVENDGHARLQRDGRVRLDWRDATRVLKPGQILDRTTGEVYESYARPRAATAAPAPEPTPSSGSAGEPATTADLPG